MKLRKIINYLESIAPPAYQEGYDNSGLIVGHPDMKITGAIVCLDSTEEVIEEAILKNCNLVVAHHPIVFKGLKRFNGHDYVERTIIKAIKNDIAIYAIHTNLDNVYRQGVNTKIAEMLGLKKTSILAPKSGLLKLFAFVPTNKSDAIRNQMFGAGAGQVGDKNQMSYASLGVGSQNGKGGGMVKLEVIFDPIYKRQILQVLEDNLNTSEIVYDLIKVENTNDHVGSGMIGELPRALDTMVFLTKLKTTMKVGCIKYTNPTSKKIKTVAVCGGSGGFLLKNAIAKGADIFITADYKYHEYFDADGRIMIADIGHYESEQFTIDLLFNILSNKFSNFAPASERSRLFLTEINTNPVNYL